MSRKPRKRRSSRGTGSRDLPVRLKLLFYPLGVVLGCGILFFAAFAFLSPDAPATSTAGDTIGSPSFSPDQESEGGRHGLVDLLRSHTRSMGLKGSNSLAFNGTYTSANQDFQLFILAKRPGLVRHALRSSDSVVSAFFDGTETWLEFTLGESPVQRRNIDPLNARVLRLECQIAALLWHFEDDFTSGLKLVGTREIDGDVLQIVENTALIDVPVLHFLDPETGLERFRKATVDLGERSSEIEIRYGAYQSQDGLRWPGSYEVFLSGTLVSAATIESVRMNAGVVPLLFQPRSSRNRSESEAAADGS